MFYKVTADKEFVNTEPLSNEPGERSTALGSCEHPVTTFSSVDLYITLFHVCFKRRQFL